MDATVLLGCWRRLSQDRVLQTALSVVSWNNELPRDMSLESYLTSPITGKAQDLQATASAMPSADPRRKPHCPKPFPRCTKGKERKKMGF